MGRDARTSRAVVMTTRFNPRAPCGARRYVCHVGISFFLFQSTRPVWGATDRHPVRILTIEVSIHAPRVGRDYVFTIRGADAIVSIHAPRVGRDFEDAMIAAGIMEFQSTRPVWGATLRTP